MNQAQTDFLAQTAVLASMDFTTDSTIKTILALKTELRTVQGFTADEANGIVDKIKIYVTPDFLTDTTFFNGVIANYAQAVRNLATAIASLNTDNDKTDLLYSLIKSMNITYLN